MVVDQPGELLVAEAGREIECGAGGRRGGDAALAGDVAWR